MLYEGKNILITGGAGFIGSNLAIRLVNEGANVTVVDSMLPDYGGNLFNLEPVRNKLNINFSDIRDYSSLSYLVKEKDIIFNLAGQVSHSDSMQNPLLDMDINARAQLSLLEACRYNNSNAKIIFTSTRQLYGSPKYLPVDEEHVVNPPDINGVNKFAGEQYHLLYYKAFGIKTVSLRLTNTYGPRQLIKNARQGFIGWFINRVITGTEIQLFGTGEQIRDFNYVDDVVDALILASGNDNCIGQCYNLSGDKSSLKEIAEILIACYGSGSYKIVPFPEERKKIDIGNFYGNSDKFCRETGWKPKVNLKEGLRRTIDFYNKYKERYLGELQ